MQIHHHEKHRRMTYLIDAARKIFSIIPVFLSTHPSKTDFPAAAGGGLWIVFRLACPVRMDGAGVCSPPFSLMKAGSEPIV
ncbi:hypothetical protein [Desulfosarcina alkanivorans]|jgi:hypothetical protein|uniref:hypothetical protein n=1 Tax=Desulfosarcina alkanivorans TaxID=571177 RepID=UPI0012D2B87C|nr:hypothetical protein [Desulfosarcina alkanivorans]